MSNNLAALIDEAQAKDVSSERLDDEVLTAATRELAGTYPAGTLAEEAAWAAERINAEGLERQIEYLVEQRGWRWVHEMIGDLS